MTSKSVFTYPVPHSTFIPISHRSVSPNQSSRKRKRTKSSATNVGDENEDRNDGTGLRTPSPQGFREIWTPVNPCIHGSGVLDHACESAYEGQRKRLGSNFEHRIRKAGYGEDITDALPPVQPTSLQAKHTNNLNTILHLCVLRQDWKRAKRAFKLLLMSDSAQDVKNLTLKKIWKIGAEILSWECEERPAASQQESSRGDDVLKRDYSKILEYLNRLVIMYPHYKQYVVGKGVNATTILPILMHFEILALQDKLSQVQTGGEGAAVIQIISGIGGLTGRLKGLQETPPWVDMVDLWQLRGMLHIWAAELSLKYLNDNKAYQRHGILAHKVADKMRAREIPGWEVFTFEHNEEDEGPADRVQVVV